MNCSPLWEAVTHSSDQKFWGLWK